MKDTKTGAKAPDQLYYCFIRSDSDKVKRNCLKLTRNWLIISK